MDAGKKAVRKINVTREVRKIMKGIMTGRIRTIKLYLFFLVFAGMLASCGSRGSADSAGDSTSRDTPFTDERDSVTANAGDAPEIRTSLENLIAEHSKKKKNQSTLRLSVSGYEYKTDGTWKFDSLTKLTHCVQEWASEGIEGTSHYFFRRERLYAVYDENRFDGRKEVDVYHEELGGLTYVESRTASDSVVKILSRKFLADHEQSMRTQFIQIIKLLKDNQSYISSANPAKLHLENDSTDEEMPGTETTDITVDRKLLEELVE